MVFRVYVEKKPGFDVEAQQLTNELTTILGMIPLLGDSLFGPAAVVIMGGLLVGTLITLLFIPVLYALFYRIRIK